MHYMAMEWQENKITCFKTSLKRSLHSTTLLHCSTLCWQYGVLMFRSLGTATLDLQHHLLEKALQHGVEI